MIYLLKDIISNNNSNSFFYYIKDQLIALYSQLSICDKIEDNKLLEIIRTNSIYVYINSEFKIYGIITLLFENKIIHNGGMVCHIEDLVVDKQYRNQNIGRILVNHAIHEAKKKGCYKIILNCNNEVKNFYLKCGFEEKNLQMALYF